MNQNTDAQDNTILFSLGYFPPVNWFVLASQHEKIVLEQHEHYVKGSYRNRCKIIASDGPLGLTIPLRKGKNQQQPIKEVQIAYDEPWQIRHWRAICSAYGNSPFFEHYAHRFRPYFESKQYELLWDWNYDLLKETLKILKLDRPINFTINYEKKSEGAVDARSNINIQAVDYQLVKYAQVFEDRLGFVPNTSILDLIFCAGRLPNLVQ